MTSKPGFPLMAETVRIPFIHLSTIFPNQDQLSGNLSAIS